MKAKNKATGEVVNVLYETNRLGNKRLWVNGKFYSDKQFAKGFTIIKEAA